MGESVNWHMREEALLVCSVLLFICGCATGVQNKKYGMEAYYQALQDTDPHKHDMMQPGSEKEREAVTLFGTLYVTYTEDNIRRYVRDIYAQDAYYRDSFIELQGLGNIEAYLIQGTHIMHEVTFDLQDVAEHDGNYYFRWVTKFSLKRKKDDVMYLPGMSHVRFNKEGKIIFHQDFWDAGIIYERLPIIGFFIRIVKKGK